MSSHPASALAPETRWVLARALLHPDFPIEVPPDVDRIWAEATRLRMAPRIATRCGSARLTLELGELHAQRYLDASRQAAVQALKVEAQVRHLAAIAEKHDLRFALLKGAALHILRIVPLGARPLCDLDILMSPKAASELQRILKAEGWRENESFRTDFHLPPLYAAPWLGLEIHDVIPRVSLNGRRWSGLGELHSAGLLDTCFVGSASVLVPAPRVLAAHAIVARQALTIPGLADYLDLRRARNGADATAWVETVWFATQVPAQRLIEAVSAGEELCRSMETGASSDAGTERVLDRAGLVFDEQPQVTRFTVLRPKRGSPTPIRGVLRRTLLLVFPPITRLDSRYGQPTWRVAYAWLYLRRILHALARTLVGGVAENSGRDGHDPQSSDTTAGSPGPTSETIRQAASEGVGSCLDHPEASSHPGRGVVPPTANSTHSRPR